MRMPACLRRCFLALGVMVASSLPAKAMNFQHEFSEWNPIVGSALQIVMTGPVVEGDTERFRRVIDLNRGRKIGKILILLDSPGGNLVEGLALGRAISELETTTVAQVGSSKRPNAICASSCVYVFLGADYRHLGQEGRIGVHRFSAPGTNIHAEEALELAQAMSGVISSYIREMRADPAFFERMVDTSADGIDWVPEGELKEYRVVNGHIYDETAVYRNIDGEIGLDLEQVSYYGWNRMIFSCPGGKPFFLVNLHEPEMAMIGSLELVMDGEGHRIENWGILKRENYRFLATFRPPKDLLEKMRQAGSVGARVVVPGGDFFFGFEQKLRDDKLREMVDGCLGEIPGTAPVAGMRLLGNVDFLGADLTRTGIRGVDFNTCQDICNADRECVAVSYVIDKQWCWPKRGTEGFRAAEGVISAIKE